jgi:hypothetical protein
MTAAVPAMHGGVGVLFIAEGATAIGSKTPYVVAGFDAAAQLRS